MKKHHWHAFWHEKLFEKHPHPHPQPHCQTPTNNWGCWVKGLDCNIKRELRIKMKTKTFEDWSVNNMFQNIHDVSRKNYNS